MWQECCCRLISNDAPQLGKAIPFPDVLDLRSVMIAGSEDTQPIYDLRAAVIHLDLFNIRLRPGAPCGRRTRSCARPFDLGAGFGGAVRLDITLRSSRATVTAGTSWTMANASRSLRRTC